MESQCQVLRRERQGVTPHSSVWAQGTEGLMCLRTHQGTKAEQAWRPWLCGPRRLWTLCGSTAMFLRTCHRMPDLDSSGSR